MKQTAVRSVSDMELISSFNAGDSVSFTLLFERYLPLIHKLEHQYYFQDIDAEDWEQESRIVLMRTIRRYSASRGVAFSYFFKLSLQNHAYDIIRRENAAKRIQADQKIDIDDAQCGDELVDAGCCTPDELVICHECIKEFIASCSPTERCMFALIHAGQTPQEVARFMHCDLRRVTSALDRCHHKLQKRLADTER